MPRSTFALAARRALVLTAAVGLLLSGCGSVRGGEAAKVGDQVIPVAALEDYLDDLTRESGEGTPNADASIKASQTYLNFQIQRRLIEQVADQLGISARPSQVDALAKATRKQEMPQYGDTQAYVKGSMKTSEIERELAEVNVLQQRMQSNPKASTELKKALEETTVTINPRYGTWEKSMQIDPKGGQLVTVGKQEPQAPAQPPVPGEQVPPGQPAPEGP